MPTWQVYLKTAQSHRPTQGWAQSQGEEVRGAGWLRVQICRLTPTVGDTVEQIAMMAEALEASRRVDTYVVTGSIKGTLVYIWKSKNSKPPSVSWGT